MEAQSRSASSSSAVAYPRWVMLEQLLDKVDDDSSCSPSDDAKTLAAALTSTGRPIQVSLCLAEPPALSRVCLRTPDGVKVEESRVLAAHGDSVLIQVRIKDNYPYNRKAEDFIYNAGAAAADPPRPPSLLLLQDTGLAPEGLCHYATGLLRRGDDELVVAEIPAGSFFAKPMVVKLYVFRYGERDSHDVEIRADWDLPARWDTVLPVGDGMLCWVGFYHGVMLLHVFQETPRLQYLRLPKDLPVGSESIRNVCVTAGGGALKFVNIFPRCCCGGAGSTSSHAYTIHTWTMRIDGGGGEMEWVKDSMVDATELWALDAYKGIPCAPLCRPIVSTDEPDIICFSLRWPEFPVWQIMVNMRSKTIHSVSRHEFEVGFCQNRNNLIPSNVSRFFNTRSGGADTTLTGQRVDVDIERSPAVVVDSSNATLQQPSASADPASVKAALLEMSEALQEIPSYGLFGPDEVKAYRILITSDNGRRLRSFLRLPNNLRKDWLLTEIKTCDAN